MGKRTTVNWSNEEDDYILSNYKTMTDKDIAMALNRTEAAVKLHRLIMGLNKVTISTKKKCYTVKHEVTPEERAAKANRKAAIGLIELLDGIMSGKIIVESSESNCKLGELHTITIEYRNAPMEKYRELVVVSL